MKDALEDSFKFIHEYFAEVAKDNPHLHCIEYEDRIFTYEEINRRANKLARYIKNIGAGPEQIIGLYLERTPEMIISILAVFKAGAAYAPISTAYPKDRLEYLINDAGLQVILTSSNLERGLSKLNTKAPVTFVYLDKEKEDIDRESEEEVPCLNERNNLAYVIFTSGSTGRPKGVMIEHGGITNMVLEQINAFNINKNDRVLQYASIAFDASVSEIFTALLAGAALVLLPNKGLYLGEDLYQVLRKKKITVVTLTPSVLNTLPPKELPALKTLVSAGEACTKKLIDYWSSKLNFINAYGPTECTVCASMNICSSADEGVSLGKPIANTAFYLLDKQLCPVPAGETGELCIAGVGLARGYLNLTSLTEESFCRNPFMDGISERLYRTGDICRRGSKDSFEWVGREDNQVKIAGLRIDLDELIQVLREYPGILDAVITIVDDSFKNKQVYAYIITDSSQKLSIKEIKAYVRAKLPAYMVPSRFMFISEIPVLESGKLDKNSLPSMEDVRPDIDAAYAEPRSQMEAAIAQIWCEILKIDRVGIYDNFFDLGGQSLMATQIVSRIRSTLGMEIPLHVLFEAASTVEQTAAAIERYQLEQYEPEELEQLLSELEGLSEEELAAILKEME
ncbi:non-ribosomal peptide synthetase [Anaerocolumna jejuensis]|uniref:non-ribosomal peptide synthetase n=1 Tax=Anaerocolumna jejuensis TaxID=259063 RepID=UPI003F7BC1E3